MKIIYYNWHKLTLFRPGCHKLTVSLKKKKLLLIQEWKKIECTLQIYTTTYEHANECFLICTLIHKDVHIDARKWKILKQQIKLAFLWTITSRDNWVILVTWSDHVVAIRRHLYSSGCSFKSQLLNQIHPLTIIWPLICKDIFNGTYF